MFHRRGAYGAHRASDLVDGGDHLLHYYDARGNQTIRDGTSNANDREATYAAAGHAIEIAQAGQTTRRFWYGPDGQRYKQVEGGNPRKAG